MKRWISILLAAALMSLPLPCAADRTLTDWYLEDIYESDEAFEADFALAMEKIEALSRFRGKLGTIDGVLGYYDAYDEIHYIHSKLEGYASLPVYLDQSNSAAKERYARVENVNYALNEAIAFANPELFANDDAFLDEVASDPRMAEAGHLTQFRRDRALKAHQIPESDELLLTTMYRLTNGAASLYDSHVDADLIFPEVVFPDGRVFRVDNTGYSVSMDKSLPQQFRKEVFEGMMGTYAQSRNALAQNMQNYYTGLAGSAVIHNYSSALEADMMKYDIPLDVYTSLMSAADAAQPVLARYIELIKGELGLGEMYDFDLNVPFATNPGLTFTFEESCEILPRALEVLGEEYVQTLKLGLSGGWADVYPAPGKTSGAFSASVLGAHPYVLLNYTDDYLSLTALAHEYGHAVHQYMSDANPSAFQSNPSSMISEVASTLNELLLSDYMINNAKTREEKDYYIAQQIRSLYSVFFTQVKYADFQQRIAECVEAGGTLTADALDDIWLEARVRWSGDNLALAANTQAGWARIPHFYMGFYVYKYAVAISAACNIADRILAGEPGAVESYIAYLKAGDSADAVSMLAIAGVDATNGDYIQSLINRFDRLLSEYGG